MKIIKKRGQLATFAIIGIVLVIVVLALILVFGFSKENESKVKILSSGTFDEKIDAIITSCLDSSLEEEKENIYDNKGYIGSFPNNYIVFEDEKIITTYDRDYPGVFGIEPVEYIEQVLSDVLLQKISLCTSNVNEELNKQYSDYDVYLDYVSVELTQEAILVYYSFTTEINNESNVYEKILSKKLNILKFYEEANNITKAFVDTLLYPDPNLNYKLCVGLNEENGIKPKYPLDIVEYLKEKNNAEIIFAEDFFVVKLEEEGEIFKFAIKPYLYPPVCQ